MFLIKKFSEEFEDGYKYASAFAIYRNNNFVVFLTADLQKTKILEKEEYFILFKVNEADKLTEVELLSKNVIKGEYYCFYVVEVEGVNIEDFPQVSLTFCLYDEELSEKKLLCCGGISVPFNIGKKNLEEMNKMEILSYYKYTFTKMNNEIDITTFEHNIQTHSFQNGCLIYVEFEKNRYMIYGMNTKTGKTEAAKFMQKDFDTLQSTLGRQIFTEVNANPTRVLYQVIEN